MQSITIFFSLLLSFVTWLVHIPLNPDYLAIKGQYEFQDYQYVYGSIDPNHQWTERNAFLQVLDKANHREIYTLKIEEEGIQEPVFFGRLSDDRFLFVVEFFYYFESFSIHQFRFTEWFVLDSLGMYVESIQWESRALDYVNVLDIMIVQTDTQKLRIHPNLETESLSSLQFEVTGEQPFQVVGMCDLPDHSILEEASVVSFTVQSHRGYQYPFVITVDPMGVSLYQDKQTSETITWVSQGELFLNGIPFTSGETISTPGHHILQIFGKNQYQRTIPFTILPHVAGLPSSGISSEAVQIITNASSMKVNGERYPSGHTFYQSGFYQVLVEGSGGYQEVHTFTILPFVYGLKDGDMIKSPWTLYLNSEATLNGQPILDGTVLSQNGQYELQLYYQGEITDTIRFEIQLDSSMSSDRDPTFPFQEVGLTILALIGIYLVFKKK